MQSLFLEDIHVGQRFTSAPRTVTKEDIIDFGTRYDPQVFHLDEDAAKSSFFKTLVASGWHTGALTMRMLVDSVKLSGGVIGLGGEITWAKPVLPNDTLHVETEVLEVTPLRSKPGRAIVLVRCSTQNQKDETVQTLTAKLLAFSRDAAL